MESPEGQGWLASGNIRAFTKALTEVIDANLVQIKPGLQAITRDADVVVAGILMEDWALPLTEAAAIPLMTLHSAPVRRTSVVASPMVTTRALPGPLNRASGAVFERVWWKGFKNEVAAWRTQLDLPVDPRTTADKMRASSATELQAYSSSLIPGLQQDYGRHRPLVGFLEPDDALRQSLGEAGVETELDAWLTDGEPPVYFGFGSMPITDPAAAMTMIDQATRRLGVRGLISSGWGRLEAERLGPHLHSVGTLNHSSVLPRCQAAVHHGGAGTTAAAVRAGIPSVVCSVFADQPFWGSRLERLGTGTHLPFATLDVNRLTTALRQVLHPDAKDRARGLGQRLSAEPDAASRAAELIEAAGTAQSTSH